MGASNSAPIIDRLSHDVLALIATEADEALALSCTCQSFADLKRHVQRLRIVAPRQDCAMNWRALAGFTQCTHAEVFLTGAMGQPRADMFSKEAMTAACRYLPRLALLRMPWHGHYEDEGCAGYGELNAYAFALSEQVCELSRAGLLPTSLLVQHPVPRLLGKSLEHNDHDRDLKVLDDEQRDLLLNYYPKHRLASFLLHSEFLYKEDPRHAGEGFCSGRDQSPVNEQAIEVLRPLLHGGSNPGSVGLYDAVRFERGSAPCSFRAAGVSLLMDACAGALIKEEFAQDLREFDIDIDFMTFDYARIGAPPPIPGNPFLVALVAAGARFEIGEKAALLGALRAVCPLAEAVKQEAKTYKYAKRYHLPDTWLESVLSSTEIKRGRATIQAQYAAAIAFVESVPDT